MKCRSGWENRCLKRALKSMLTRVAVQFQLQGGTLYEWNNTVAKLRALGLVARSAQKRDLSLSVARANDPWLMRLCRTIVRQKQSLEPNSICTRLEKWCFGASRNLITSYDRVRPSTSKAWPGNSPASMC